MIDIKNLIKEKGMIDIEGYLNLLQKLEKSNTLPRRDLETRYRKAYRELKDKVRRQTVEVIKHICFQDFVYRKGIYKDINKILKEYTALKILNNVYNICDDPDYEKVESTALELRSYVIRRLKEEEQVIQKATFGRSGGTNGEDEKIRQQNASIPK